MDIARLASRAKSILLSPKTEWTLIGAEKSAHTQLLTSWLLPLALIPAVAALIGYGFIGSSTGGAHAASLGLGLRQALLQILSLIGGAYITAFIINALAEKFASEKNLDRAFALTVYSYTPACLGGVFQLVPSLSFLGSLAGLYGLYLLYAGLTPLMKTPPEKNARYFAASLLCILGVFLVLSALLGVMLMV